MSFREEAARIARKDAEQRLRRVKLTTCRTHQKRPTNAALRKTSKGYEISFGACCDELERRARQAFLR